MRTKAGTLLVVFTIRPFRESDLDQLISVYQSAFAEPPWNEEWTAEQVEEDLRYAQKQDDCVVLVACDDDRLVGFTWGYRMPIEKFPFLEGLVEQGANYMDEMAVLKQNRTKGVGTLLGKEYFRIVSEKGAPESVLRTDRRNTASVALFGKLGYTRVMDSDSPVMDPEFEDRLYFRRCLP